MIIKLLILINVISSKKLYMHLDQKMINQIKDDYFDLIKYYLSSIDLYIGY